MLRVPHDHAAHRVLSKASLGVYPSLKGIPDVSTWYLKARLSRWEETAAAFREPGRLFPQRGRESAWV